MHIGNHTNNKSYSQENVQKYLIRELMKHPPLGMLSPSSTGTPRTKTLLLMRGSGEAHGKHDAVDDYNLTSLCTDRSWRTCSTETQRSSKETERSDRVQWQSYEQRTRHSEEEENTHNTTTTTENLFPALDRSGNQRHKTCRSMSRTSATTQMGNADRECTRSARTTRARM